jgi:type VI protein secretion system component Hcp
MRVYGKFPGITGKTKGKYAGWVSFDSIQAGSSTPIRSTVGAGYNRTIHSSNLSELILVRRSDELSTLLYRLATWSRPLDLVFEVAKESPGTVTTVLRIEVESAFVSGFSSANERGLPMETITLSFSKIQYTAVAASAPAPTPKLKVTGLHASLSPL